MNYQLIPNSSGGFNLVNGVTIESEFPPCCLHLSLGHEPDWEKTQPDPIEKYLCWMCAMFIPSQILVCQEIDCPCTKQGFVLRVK